jgi:hypothetical protein
MIPSRARRTFFIALLLLAGALFGGIYFVGAPLETAAAPWGFRSFQLAGDPVVCHAIVGAWNAANSALPLRACFLAGLDFLFVLLYANCLGLACIWSAEQFEDKGLHACGAILAWLQWVAGATGVLGNAMAAVVLLGQRGTFWPQQARFQTVSMVCLACLGLAFVLLGAIQNAMSFLYVRRSAAPQKAA